jgi:glutamyl-tRNA reductase
MADVARRRKGRPLFLIDLSVPRNIDPAVNDLEDIFLYNIDDLNSVVEANRREREREAVKAEAIIDEEIEQMMKWLKSLDVTPTIVDLRRRVEELRRAEVERALARHRSGVGSEEALRSALDGVTTALVNKLLHTPLVVLKDEATQTQGSAYVELVRRLFHLDESAPESRTAIEPPRAVDPQSERPEPRGT